jgi:twitching motility protein PilT
MSVVRQREVGADVESFSDALKFVLRQDPDVIVVGEMRDLETISLAMSAAETGHLVLATLHTISAQATVERIVDVFPASQQLQMRAQLASCLEGVICQALLPTAAGKGRVCAAEVMVSIPAVRAMIRDGQHHRLMNVVETSARFGMTSLNQSLRELVARQKVTLDAALACSPDPDGLKKMIELTRREA